MLHVLDTGIDTADKIMRFDEKLLEDLDPNGNPILHFYDWSSPSATYGYFIDPKKHLDLAKAQKHNLALARRPTGGGIVFHIWDLAFSFLLPSNHPAFSLNTLENYRFVNQAVLEAAKELFALKEPVELISQSAPSQGPDCQNFCMAKPTQYDVVYQGMKIAGAAQRKRKQGYLHQGTISLAAPDLSLLKDVLLSKDDVVQAMTAYSFAPLGKTSCFEETRSEIKRKLADILMQKLAH
jgi:lipoate-protein ligase A